MTLINKAEALLPCPFCGEALFTKAADSRSDLLSVHHPSSDCLLSGESWWLVPKFTAAWNRRAIPARGVVVRKLVWNERGVAKCAFGKYHIIDLGKHWEGKADRFDVSLNGADVSGHPNEASAKAAAQADYEARILAALAPTDAATTTEKGGDAHAVDPRHAPHEASPGVTAGADAAQARPAWLSNCVICGRIVDTREKAEGGDGHGCEYPEGWTCSSECAEKLHPDPEWMKEGLAAQAREAALRDFVLREALAAVNKAREAVIHSGNRVYIDGISVGHDRAERAILALISEART